MSTIYTDQCHSDNEESEHEGEIRKRSQSSPPSKNKPIAQVCDETGKEISKKKIIPVQSDFDSSPSPEDPSSPVVTPPVFMKNRSRMSKSTVNLTMQEDKEMERKKRSLGLKLNGSYSRSSSHTFSFYNFTLQAAYYIL